MDSCDTSANLSRNRNRQLDILANLTTLEDLDDNEERMTRTSNAIKEAKSLLNDSSIQDHAQHPSEIHIDSCVLRKASNLAVRCSEDICGNINIYNKQDLALNIRMNPDAWSFMFPKEAPAVGFLYGTFAPTPPEQRPRAPRRQVQKQQAKTLKAPTALDRLEKAEENSQMVSAVNRFITTTYRNTKKPLSYFHTVIDPHSFSATIENIYYVSFLVQDTKISVQLDDVYGLPFITPVPAAQRDQTGSTEQLIISMDKQKWKDLIEAFDITEPMMVFSQ